MEKEYARVAQRRRHKKNDKIALEERIRDNERQSDAIERQFVEIGEIHEVDELDPVEDAPIPFIVHTEDTEARRFRTAERAAVIVGAFVAAGLSVQTMVGGEFVVFLIGLGLALLIAAVLVGVMLGTARANARNPGARRILARWLTGFGAITFLSLTAFLYWRFVENLQALQQVGIAIVGFEIGMFGLAAVFHGLFSLYSWSRELTEQHQRLKDERAGLEQELVTATDELDRLEAMSTGKIVHATFAESNVAN